MLIVQNISYIHPDRTLLFTNLSFSVAARTKVALIGNNGSGKSTLLKLIANQLETVAGHIKSQSAPYYIPQLTGQFDHYNVAEILGIEKQLRAYYSILKGEATVENLLLLDDDWTIEDRCIAALEHWGLSGLDLFTNLKQLSGGEKTKVFLAGIHMRQPDFILLDEPSNHLDGPSRQRLYDFIKQTASTLLVVSHDRQLLDLMEQTMVLSADGIASYGGNYSFYASQQSHALAALKQTIQHKEKELRKAKAKEKETLERQQRMDVRGKKKQEQAGVARIMINTLRNAAENSTSKTKAIHNEKINGIAAQLTNLRMSQPDTSKIRFGFTDSTLHRGKILLEARGINIKLQDTELWPSPMSLQIKSGDRVLLKGANATGKTTLIRLLLADLAPSQGQIFRQIQHKTYIDQDYSLLDDSMTVYEQAKSADDAILEEHIVKTRLDQFLFPKDSWSKKVGVLSGGEKMRLALCYLTLHPTPPELIILDEPTNNLDIQSVDILTSAVLDYQGTLIVISHDKAFTQSIGIDREIELEDPAL